MTRMQFRSKGAEPRDPHDVSFLSGGGELGALMRSHDWSASLGPPAFWPQALCTAVRLILNTGHPMYVFWGRDLACLYNDAYRQSIGPERHPGSLGRPAREVWSEIWDIIGPQIEQVMSGGGPTWHVDQLVPITRHGRRDDVYWTYSYSPIDDKSASAGIGGVLVVCTETTQQILAARHLASERDQQQELAEALRTSEGAFRELAKQLTDASHAKDEFLATLAHELRNPLAPIHNALELMARAPTDAGVIVESRAIIGRQLGHLVRLIDDLLDLARVSRGNVVLRRSPSALAGALADAVEISRPLIDLRGHSLTVTLPDEALMLNIDRTRIVQVFANLLNNAAKFTPPGGHIMLTLARDGDTRAVVTVRDNGVGIPEAMLDAIFDMFTQVDRSQSQVGGGLGIGLWLVRRLIELHDGSVEARSNGAGAGSEFMVRLPLTQAAWGTHASGYDSTVVPVAPATVARRILVADDNVDAADSLSMLLRFAGHHTRTAYDGERALALAREFQPDVMLLDIGMPGRNGYELARSIRSEHWGRDVLLIAVSGWGQAEDQLRSRDAGFDHHLVKPVELEIFERLLQDRPS